MIPRILFTIVLATLLSSCAAINAGTVCEKAQIVCRTAQQICDILAQDSTMIHSQHISQLADSLKQSSNALAKAIK